MVCYCTINNTGGLEHAKKQIEEQIAWLADIKNTGEGRPLSPADRVNEAQAAAALARKQAEVDAGLTREEVLARRVTALEEQMRVKVCEIV